MSDLVFRKISKRTCKYHLGYINSNISEKRPLHLSDLTERKLLENRILVQQGTSNHLTLAKHHNDACNCHFQKDYTKATLYIYIYNNNTRSLGSLHTNVTITSTSNKTRHHCAGGVKHS